MSCAITLPCVETWEPALDGGQYLIRGTWEARITPRSDRWAWRVWRWGSVLSEGVAQDAESAREACEERMDGTVKVPGCRRRESLGPKRSGRRQLPTVVRLLALLEAGERTTAELREILGLTVVGLTSAIGRARRRGIVIRYETTGTQGEGVYRVEVEA